MFKNVIFVYGLLGVLNEIVKVILWIIFLLFFFLVILLIIVFMFLVRILFVIVLFVVFEREDWKVIELLIDNFIFVMCLYFFEIYFLLWIMYKIFLLLIKIWFFVVWMYW